LVFLQIVVKFVVCQVGVEPITLRMTRMATLGWCDCNFP
jgi:hypothetical protein